MEQDLRTYSPLALAFLGDGVYGLYIRDYLVRKGNARVRSLHHTAAGIVSAVSQAKAADHIEGILTEEEAAVMKRGANAHVSHQAKNASSYDYHKATGLEALFGYLYLADRKERIEELTALCIEAWEQLT